MNVFAREPSPIVKYGTMVQGYIVRRACDTDFFHVFRKFAPVRDFRVSVTLTQWVCAFSKDIKGDALEKALPDNIWHPMRKK